MFLRKSFSKRTIDRERGLIERPSSRIRWWSRVADSRALTRHFSESSEGEWTGVHPNPRLNSCPFSCQYAIAGQTVWPICQGLVKVSICLTFIRIFFTRTFRIAATIVCCICVCWTVSTILVGYLICTPLYSQWNPTVTAKCGNESIAYVSLGVLDVLTELMVFALPMPMLYTLQVPKRTKVALIGTFCLCTFTVIAGIMRLVAVIQINFGTNFQQDIVADAYWCAIESSVGMTVANSLIMRPLLDRFLSLFGGLVRSTRALETSYRSNTGDYSTSGTSKGAKDGTFIRLEEQQSRPPRANAAVWKP